MANDTLPEKNETVKGTVSSKDKLLFYYLSFG
jgi:hypothetical protein